MSNILAIATCDPWAPTLVAHLNMNKNAPNDPSTSIYVPFIQVRVGGENFVSPLLYANIFLDDQVLQLKTQGGVAPGCKDSRRMFM